MSALLPQALRDISSLRIKVGESTGVLSKLKINKTMMMMMMMKKKSFSLVRSLSSYQDCRLLGSDNPASQSPPTSCRAGLGPRAAAAADT